MTQLSISLPSFLNFFIPKSCIRATLTLRLPAHERDAAVHSGGRFVRHADLCGTKPTRLRLHQLKRILATTIPTTPISCSDSFSTTASAEGGFLLRSGTY